MKKTTACTLVAGALSLGMAGQATATHLSPTVNKANNLRASAWAMNRRASQVEYRIRCLQAQGHNPVHLKQKAHQMRRKATTLAQMSNQVARSAFNNGYHRPNHSHQRRAQPVRRVVYQQPARRYHVVHRPVVQHVYHRPQVRTYYTVRPVQRVHQRRYHAHNHRIRPALNFGYYSSRHAGLKTRGVSIGFSV